MKAQSLIALLGAVLVTSAFGAEPTQELQRLQALLKSPEFALEMASHLDAAYHRGIGKTPPPFIQADEEAATVPKSVKEEKIATNLAGFYALESGLGLISERTKEPPAQILDSIIQGTRSQADMWLLARFANATWKAGQPFRALNRITRDAFKPAALLTEAELKKDVVQIEAGARQLRDAMRDVAGEGRPEQLKRLLALLQSRDFAAAMAAHLDAAYYRGQGQSPPPFLRPEEETAAAPKRVKEEKIAVNLAGFYAVEVGITVIGERTRESPIQILESIADGTRSTDDMLLLARLANATWKAGQPFRSLSRITRATFVPAAMLTEDELKKDFDQIRAASGKLLEAMRRR